MISTRTINGDHFKKRGIRKRVKNLIENNFSSRLKQWLL